MPRDSDHVIVFRTTMVRGPGGRMLVLTPGLKTRKVSEQIRSLTSRAQRDQMRKGGRITDDTPPWREETEHG